jgi:AbrB family looped-hinge helix DNA binding protein
VAGRIGPKGQVVIPKHMREVLGLRPGGTVSFRVRPGDAVIEIVPSWDDPIRDGPAVIQALGQASPGLTETASEELLRARREDEELWLDQLGRQSSKR